MADSKDKRTEPLRQRLESLGYTVTWQGSNQPITVSKDGQSYSISPSEYSISGGKAYVAPETLQKITGYVPLRSSLEDKYDIGWNPSTKEVSVTHPVTGQEYTFKPETVWGGRTYVDPKYLERIKSRVTPAYEKTYSDLSSSFDEYFKQQQDLYNRMYQEQQQLLTNYMNQINDYMKRYSDYGLAMLRAYEVNYSRALNELQKLTQQQTQVPESVKLAINMIKEQVDNNVKALNEEMIRRGIFSSGLAAKAERELREGGTTEQQKILAQWLDQQHRQMYEASLRLAQAYQDYATGYTNVLQKAYQEPLAQLMSQAAQNYQLMSSLLQQRQTNLASLAKERYDTIANLRRWLAEQEEAARTSRQEAETERLKAQLQAETERLKAQLQAERSLYPWTMGMTPYQQALLEETRRWHDLQYALGQQRIASGASTNSLSDLIYSAGLLALSNAVGIPLEELLNEQGK